MFTERSFVVKYGQYDLISYNQCTTMYVNGFNDAIILNGDIPIFLDANIILRYYSISFNARKKFYEFLEENIERIFLTSQVQKEILKNRGDNIKKFFQQVSKKVPQEFKSDVVNQLQSFLEKHKTILKDYPYMESELSTHKEQLEVLLKKLNDDTQTKYDDNKTLVWKDSLIDLLCKANVLDALSKQELEQVQKDFDTLKKGIDIAKIDSVLNKSTSVFPGLGDIKEKPDDPYGDFIIYHEILKYQYEKQTDSIFLTFDNTKGDWMSLSKEPYLHYVYNMYLNTGKIIYIVDAERTLEKILDINIESLIIEQNFQQNSILSIEDVDSLFATHSIFTGRTLSNCDKGLLDQLHNSGYDDIIKLSTAMDKLISIIPLVLEKYPGLSTVGVVRLGLRLIDERFEKTMSSIEGPSIASKQLQNLKLHIQQ